MSTQQRILVITDCTDIAASELHATLVANLDSLNANHVVVEPVVGVQEFSILHGSFSARLLAESYLPGSLTILAVVNPLDTANSKRARIAGILENGIRFVGANTGIFSWLIKDFGLRELVETDPTGLRGDGFISFGGKYIHAPIAAKFAATGDINSVKVGDFNEDELLTVQFEQGTVVHIDNFGVAKLFYKSDEFLAQPGDTFKLTVQGHEIGEATYCHSMKELTDGTVAIYKGSSLGMLEIGIVRHLDTAQKLGLSIGDVVSIVPR